MVKLKGVKDVSPFTETSHVPSFNGMNYQYSKSPFFSPNNYMMPGPSEENGRKSKLDPPELVTPKHFTFNNLNTDGY